MTSIEETEQSPHEKEMNRKEQERIKRVNTPINGTLNQLDHVLDWMDSDGGFIQKFETIRNNVSITITGGDFGTRNLQLLLEKLCDDKYVKARPVGNGIVEYVITFHGRESLSNTSCPFRRQLYREKHWNVISKKVYNAAKTTIAIIASFITIVIAAGGLWLAWVTYSQEGKNSKNIEQINTRLEKLEQGK